MRIENIEKAREIMQQLSDIERRIKKLDIRREHYKSYPNKVQKIYYGADDTDPLLILGKEDSDMVNFVCDLSKIHLQVKLNELKKQLELL